MLTKKASAADAEATPPDPLAAGLDEAAEVPVDPEEPQAASKPARLASIAARDNGPVSTAARDSGLVGPASTAVRPRRRHVRPRLIDSIRPIGSAFSFPRIIRSDRSGTRGRPATGSPPRR